MVPIISRCESSSVPTSVTKWSLLIGEMEFCNLKFKQKYERDGLAIEERFKPALVRVILSYATLKSPIYMGL